MPIVVVYSALAAAFITVLTVMVLRPAAVRFGLISHPGGHRHHSGRPPLIGGIAILLGITAGFVVLGSYQQWSVLVLVCGAWFLTITGMIDDWREMPSVARFIMQGVAAYVMVEIGNVWLVDLGRLVSDDVMTLGRWAVPLSVFAAVGVINAINMSDGMDGLASSLVLVTIACLIHFTAKAGSTFETALLVIIAVPVFIFWILNSRMLRRRPAQIYMGDAGSTLLGWILAWFLIELSQGEDRAFQPVTALWLIALPLFDAVGVMLRRVIRGISPFTADRRHYHHYLLAAGLSVNQTTIVVVATALLFAGVGILGEYFAVQDRYLFFAFLTLFAIHVGIMEYLDRKTTLPERTETVEAEPI